MGIGTIRVLFITQQEGLDRGFERGILATNLVAPGVTTSLYMWRLSTQ